LKIDDFDPCPAEYTIGYWQMTDGTLIGDRPCRVATEAMTAAERAAASLLVMSDGHCAM